jgi:hypothetical protein
MTRDDRAHLLFKNASGTFPWELIALAHPIVAVGNLPLLKAAFLTCVEEGHKEIVTVVFDRSVTHEAFLEFLSSLPAGFRGDVLMIEEGSRGYLASTTGDGRILFRLQPADLDLYMHARFDADDLSMLRVQSQTTGLEWSTAQTALLSGSFRTN